MTTDSSRIIRGFPTGSRNRLRRGAGMRIQAAGNKSNRVYEGNFIDLILRSWLPHACS